MTAPRAWKPGDPIGGGEIYLPDARTRRAYGLEVAAQIIAHTPGLQRRRNLLAAANENDRDELKQRVAEVWKGKQG